MASIPLDFFLNNEELLKRHELAIPTNEMYRYFPPKEEIILSDSDPKKNYRFIFNGQPKTEYEQRKLNEYNEYELKHGKLSYPNIWLESDTMRLLQAAEFDLEKAYKMIIDTINFINKCPTSINDRIITLLNSGIAYIYGRDHHFRPIIVISVKTYVDAIEKNKYSFEDINECVIYLINYIIKYLLIPGQIENWITIVDFKSTGVSDVSDFKKLLTTLNSYRGRVFRNYFINISGFLKIAIKTAVSLFGSSSAKKLKILAKDELHKMQQLISPENIPKKYGGTAPDVFPGNNNLFPPIMPSLNYQLKGEKLNIVSEETYKEMCLNSNPFKPFMISPKYQEEWNKEKEKEKEIKKEQSDLNTNTNTLMMSESDNKLNVENKYLKEEKIEIMKLKEIEHKKKLYIMEFLKEFDEVNLLEIHEDKKYFSNPNVNIEKLNNFFQKIPKCRKIHFY